MYIWNDTERAPSHKAVVCGCTSVKLEMIWKANQHLLTNQIGESQIKFQIADEAIDEDVGGVCRKQKADS